MYVEFSNSHLSNKILSFLWLFESVEWMTAYIVSSCGFLKKHYFTRKVVIRPHSISLFPFVSTRIKPNHNPIIPLPIWFEIWMTLTDYSVSHILKVNIKFIHIIKECFLSLFEKLNHFKSIGFKVTLSFIYFWPIHWGMQHPSSSNVMQKEAEFGKIEKYIRFLCNWVYHTWSQ